MASRVEEAEVVVAGGGLAGFCAAVAAARCGANTMLIERSVYLGGMATGAWVQPLMTFHARAGNVVVGGIPQEMVERMQARGGCSGHVPDTIGFAYSITPYEPEVMKEVLLEMCRESGVTLRLNTTLSQPLMEGSKVTALELEDGVVRGRCFIDTSGDGGLAVAAGAPFEKGRKSDGQTQPLTMMFKVGNVDIEAVKRYMREHPEEFHETTRMDQLDTAPVIAVSGYFTIWKEAALDIPRDRLLFFSTLKPGEVVVNTTRITGLDPNDPNDLAKAEAEGHRQVHMVFDMMRDRVPGFERSILLGTAPQIGVRESRRVIGQYVLTADDLLTNRRFPDVVARGGFPIDIHLPTGGGIHGEDSAAGTGYDIPYRCLIPLGLDNVLIAGKCFSATFEAHASARTTPTAMAMGQAAGTAAALAVRHHVPVAEVSIVELQARLRSDGAILD